MNDQDKRTAAIRLYGSGTGLAKPDIARVLSIAARTLNDYLSETDKQIREARKQRIFDMWQACATDDEIAADTGQARRTISEKTEVLADLEALPKAPKVAALFADADFTPP